MSSFPDNSPQTRDRSASSQASADDAVVGDSGGKDEAAEATSGWTKRYVFAKISHSLAY